MSWDDANGHLGKVGSERRNQLRKVLAHMATCGVAINDPYERRLAASIATGK